MGGWIECCSCLFFFCVCVFSVFFHGIQRYTIHPVDGRNPANQLRLVFSPIILKGFIHPRRLFGISSINSIKPGYCVYFFVWDRLWWGSMTLFLGMTRWRIIVLQPNILFVHLFNLCKKQHTPESSKCVNCVPVPSQKICKQQVTRYKLTQFFESSRL